MTVFSRRPITRTASQHGGNPSARGQDRQRRPRTRSGRCEWPCRSDRAVNVPFKIGVFIQGAPKLGGDMGFLSRLLVPRSVRRAMHPVRTMKRAATPKLLKKARRALHPVDNVVTSLSQRRSRHYDPATIGGVRGGPGV